MIEVAALLTCFNRKEKTITCLEHLFKTGILKLSVYLVDDGSTDGTSEAVKEKFPEVILLKGDGSLFWNGGMHKAFKEARKKEYSHYLWLNDDTLLFKNAWTVLEESLIKAKEKSPNPTIIVGSTSDPVSGALTYGGLIRNSAIKRLKFQIVPQESGIKPCETMNGNCVLIEAEVVKRIGNLDPFFTHAIGDFDYGLRAKKSGCKIWIANDFIGTCSKNATTGTWHDRSLNAKDRLKAIKSVKGLPTKEWKEFAKRYAGVAWPIFWLSPYARIFLEQVKAKLSSS